MKGFRNMNKYLKIVLFGVVAWIVPFVISFFIYPLKTAGSPLFESIVPIFITIIVITLAYLYLKNIKTDFKRRCDNWCGLVYNQHSHRPCSVLTAKSHANDFNKLYDGHRNHLSNDTSNDHWNGIYGRK